MDPACPGTRVVCVLVQLRGIHRAQNIVVCAFFVVCGLGGQLAAKMESQLTPLLLAFWIKYVIHPILGTWLKTVVG